ncbi:MAG: cobalamin-dependent protein [Planctomycetota bacterium]
MQPTSPKLSSTSESTTRSAKTSKQAPFHAPSAIERLFEALINGDRPASRSLVQEFRDSGLQADDVLSEVFWPTYEMIERLFRQDQLSNLSYRLATRLLRVLVDRTAGQLVRRPALGRTIFAVCGPTEADELSAQIAVDLLEARGFDPVFAGGGVATDEILAQVHEARPDVLLVFAAAPGDLPATREVIDKLREINATPDTQVVVGGGVFNRAEGLAEEIGADLWASDPLELVEVMVLEPDQRAIPEQQTVGRKRREAA